MKAGLCAPLLACAVLLASGAYAASSSATPMQGSDSTHLLTLEGLGRPASINPDCATYRTRANGAHLAFGNTLFRGGFQLSIPNTCGYGEESYSWTFAHRHTRLAASLALDASNAARGRPCALPISRPRPYRSDTTAS
jgi:hypothetical protein